MNIELQSMAIEVPHVADHPNRAPFHGVLTLVDAPSDKPPAGARGHRVMLTRASAERALPSLLGMGLDYAPTLDRHDARRKVGIITEAELAPHPRAVLSGARVGADREPPTLIAPKAGALRAGHPTKARNDNSGPRGSSQITVAGYLYARDFPEVLRELHASHALGMSYEIADARVADFSAPIWTITQFTFTGAALLRRDKAAYCDTWIQLG